MAILPGHQAGAAPVTRRALPGDERRALAADDASVTAVVRSHAPFVGRSLRYLGVGEADVEDAAQEVFVVVHRRLREFEGRSSLQTWLYGICLRTAQSYRRKAAARREQATAEPPELTEPASQDADLQRQRMRRRLARVLAGLDAAQRDAFVLYEIERLPMKAVATALDCPLQTAYSRHQAARKQVLAAFADLERQEAP